MFPNYLEMYYTAHDEGRIILSDSMIREKERTRDLIASGKYFLDLEKASHAIQWIEQNYKLENGNLIVLNLWQKAMISATFGLYEKKEKKVYDPDTQEVIRTELELIRLTTRLYLIIGSGNGKTEIAGAISTYVMYGYGVPYPKVFLFSNTHKQAKLTYKNIVRAIRESKALADNSNIKESWGEVFVPYNGAELQTMSSDANNIEGIEPTMAVADELHTFNKGEIVHNVLKNEVKTNFNMLTLLISTNGTVRGKFFDDMMSDLKVIINSEELMEPRHRIWIFENENEEQLYENFANVQKSNPQYPLYISEETLREALDRALRSETEAPIIYSKNFNIPQNSSNILFSADEIDIRGFDESKLRGTNGVFGLDMSYTTDLTCLTYVTELEEETQEGLVDTFIAVKQWYFMPKDLLAERSARDVIDYQRFVDSGDLILLDGEYINQVDVYEHLHRLVDEWGINILKNGIDPHRADYILKELRDLGGKEYAYAISNQYSKALTPTIYKMKRDLASKNIRSNSKLLPLHLGAVVAYIKDDETMIMKKDDTRYRIDGAHSLVYALKAREYWLEENGYEIT